jgi:hypothetical protein
VNIGFLPLLVVYSSVAFRGRAGGREEAGGAEQAPNCRPFARGCNIGELHMANATSGCERCDWAIRRRAKSPPVVLRAEVQDSKMASPHKVNPFMISEAAGRLPLRMLAIRHSKLPVVLRPPPRLIAAGLVGAPRPNPGVATAARALAANGYVVCRGGLQPEIVSNALREARGLYDKQKFKPGSFTAGGQTVPGVDSQSRDDHILWLHNHLNSKKDGGGEAESGVPTLAALDRVLSGFARSTIEAMGVLASSEPSASTRYACFDDGAPLHCTGRSDMMVACYPGNSAAYQRHIDSMDGDGRSALDHGRCFTLVYYLNERWDEAKDGGALRLYVPPQLAAGADSAAQARAAAAADAAASGKPNEAIDIYPHADTFVIFRADRMVHEVCAAHASRLATTIWFYGGNEAHRQAAVARGAIEPDSPSR